MDGSSSHPYYNSGGHFQRFNPIFDPSEAISKNNKFKEFEGGNRKVLQNSHLCSESIQGTTLLNNQHVLDFISKDLPTQKEMVEWFYRNVTIKRNLRKGEGEKIVFKVAFPNTTLIYNDLNLLNEFGLVCDGERCDSFTVWPNDKIIPNDEVIGDEWLTSRSLNRGDSRLDSHDTSVYLKCMEGRDVIIEQLLRKCLIPTDLTGNQCSRQSTLIIYMLKASRFVNWPYGIASHMLECGGGRSIGYLPYGGLITHIMRKWNIDIRSRSLLCSNLIDSSDFADWDIYKVFDKFVKFDDRIFLTLRERVEFDKETARHGLERGIHYLQDDNESSGNEGEESYSSG